MVLEDSEWDWEQDGAETLTLPDDGMSPVQRKASHTHKKVAAWSEQTRSPRHFDDNMRR